MEKDNLEIKNYHVLPGPKMGMVTPDYLEQVAAVARKHDIPLLKITGAQRIAIGGHSLETAEKIWQEMGQPEGPGKPVGIHYIQACPGVKWCKYGRKNSLALGGKIEKELLDIPLQAKTKVGISGCALNCCECYIRDIGIFGMNKGWTLVFGGNGGGAPRIGDIIGKGLDDEEVIALAARCLEFIRQNARKLERTSRLMRRTPLEKLKKFVLE
ncbi:MAG: NAD(P)/FAD-dependent oxidoreductase [Thermodesulfobacteriota bacterium]